MTSHIKTMLTLGEGGALIPDCGSVERPKMRIRVESNCIVRSDVKGTRGLSRFLTLSTAVVVVRLGIEDGRNFGRLLREWKSRGVDLRCTYDWREKVFHAPRSSFCMINELLLQEFPEVMGETQIVIPDRRFISAVDTRTVGTQYSNSFEIEMSEESKMSQWDFDANILTWEQVVDWKRRRDEMNVGSRNVGLQLGSRRRTLRQKL